MKKNKLSKAWRIIGIVYCLGGSVLLIDAFCKGIATECLEKAGTPLTILGLGLTMFFWGALFEYND